jgi:nucleotide-binding universal stress UspA family protein
MYHAMYHRILVPIDLADAELAKPAVASALMMAKESAALVRLVNVLPATPVTLAEYVPADFDAQRRASAEEAIAIVAKETGLPPGRISTIVRQGNVDREILDEAHAMRADLIVMSSHRTGIRTYFLGSNAGHVVRYATCSVLVVRQPADGKDKEAMP